MPSNRRPEPVVYRDTKPLSRRESAKRKKQTLDPNYLVEEARELAAWHANENAPSDECRRDALEILVLIGDVEAGRRTGDINAAVVAAYWLGRYVERLGIFRPIEHAAGVGLDVLDDDQAFARNRGGTGVKSKFLAVLETIEKERKGLSTTDAAREARGKMTSPPTKETSEKYVREYRKRKSEQSED